MVVIQLASIVFLLTVLSLTLFDKSRLNTILTPFTITAWPFVIIIILVNFILIHFQFPAVTLRVQIFILVNVLILWVIGFISYYFTEYQKPEKPKIIYSDVFREFARFDLFLIILANTLVVIILFHTYSILQKHGGWAFIGDERFERMLIVGPVAHLVILAKVTFLLLFFIYKNSRYKIFIIITLTGLFFSIASIQVKYHLFWMFIIGFLYNTLSKSPQKQLKSVLNIALILFLLMNMFWIILTLAWGTFDVANMGIWEFLAKQFLNYFVAGTIVLDQWLNWGNIRPDWTLFIVFMNFYYVIMGNPFRINFVPYVSNGFLETAPGIYGNVGTSYGVYYLIGGYPLTLVMTIAIGLITYLIFYKSRTTGGPILLYFNMLSLTLALLTFFGQYFTLLPFYEMTAFFLIIIVIFKVINKAYELRVNYKIPKLI